MKKLFISAKSTFIRSTTLYSSNKHHKILKLFQRNLTFQKFLTTNFEIQVCSFANQQITIFTFFNKIQILGFIHNTFPKFQTTPNDDRRSFFDERGVEHCRKSSDALKISK
jgi:hypothetical protein